MTSALLQFLKPAIERFPRIANAYRRLRDSKSFTEQPQMTPLGFRFCGNKSMENGQFEPDETALVKSILPDVEIVINIGANIGYYACVALSNEKDVVAFEPIESNLNYLLRNIKANDWDRRAEVFPIALSNRVGVIEIFGAGTGASLIKGWAGIPVNYSTLVPCSTLNTVLGHRFDGRRLLVIVDIEGAENLMLDGATRLLEMSPKPIWLVEICVTENQPSGTTINPNILETFEKFWDRDYRSVTADKSRREISRGEIEKIVETQVNTLDTYNFLFIGKDAD